MPITQHGSTLSSKTFSHLSRVDRYPQRQQRSLRFACRCRQRYGLTLFHLSLRTGRTPPLRWRLVVHDGLVFRDHTSPHTLLVQAYQHLWLVKTHDV